MRVIARRLGRAPSTVCREIKRNNGPTKYRAVDADDRAWRRPRRPKKCLLARRPSLAQFVADKMAEGHSNLVSLVNNAHPPWLRVGPIDMSTVGPVRLDTLTREMDIASATWAMGVPASTRRQSSSRPAA